MASTAIARLSEAFDDGRLANAFYRREQLRRLRAALLKRKDAVQAATVAADGGRVTPAEAFAELYLTLAALQQLHDDDVQPARELDVEYRVAAGRDAPEARAGLGVVVLLPDAGHTLLYSVLQPVAAAVAGGNAVVVVLERTLQTLPALVADILTEALDRDILAIVADKSQAVPSAEQRGRVVEVVQTGDAAYAAAPRVLFSPRAALAVAVVDRTADVDAAARSLVDARMRFGGRSPYAPDLVLVNEFAKQAFLSAAVRHAIPYMTALAAPPTSGGAGGGSSNSNGAAAKRPGGGDAASSRPPPAPGIQTVTSGADVGLLDVLDRDALAAIGKVGAPLLYVHAVTSLDDAIETANALSAAGGGAVAAYAFGGAAVQKYLLQFLAADAGFAGAVPEPLLVGPAAPRGHAVSLRTRHPAALFTAARPRFAQPSALAAQVRQILGSGPAAPRVVQEAALLAALDLEPRAPPRSILGYFEAAFLTAAAVLGTPVVVGLGTLAFWGARKATAGWR